MKKSNVVLHQAFGRRLVEIRKGKNLTQQNMADKLNIGRSNYTYIERGKHSFNLDRIIDIALILGVSPHKLLDIYLDCRDEILERVHIKRASKIIANIMTERKIESSLS